MSRQIDEQIVKMKFDNSGFESGVKESMSSLDKLKQALHFKDVNMTPLEKAFNETEATATKAGFHIRDIWLKISETFENEIANKIVQSGERIVKALTIQGAMDGFNEYELKMGSIQTIMAGTGESLATVNRYLDELNTYSDKTIYSFKDMTDNIGKFTNAGVSLKDSVAAIKGIANEAALAGANANQASHAMYNFSQALSSGYVKLIDWKSIENANMATLSFKDTLLEVASALGTVDKTADDMYLAEGKFKEAFSASKNFNDSLQDQWMTTEVLTETLKVYATDVRELSDAQKAIYEEGLKVKGFSDEQIAAFEQMGIKAADAATQVKTFSQLIDTLKEAIGSGWAMTWQIIIGDFEQAVELFTNISNVVGGVVDAMSDARNEFLKGGLATGWERYVSMTDKAIPATDVFRQRITSLAVETGALTEEQMLSLESTNDWIRSVHESGWLTSDLLKRATREYQEYLNGLSDVELDSISVTREMVSEFDEFGKAVENGEINIEDWAEEIRDLGGRENIIQGLTNVFEALRDVFKQIGDAWNEVFPPMRAETLKDLTARFRDFTANLKLTDGALLAIKESFQAVFTIAKTIGQTVITVVEGISKVLLPLFHLLDSIIFLIGRIMSALSGNNTFLQFTKSLQNAFRTINATYLKIMQKVADAIEAIAQAIYNLPDSPVFAEIAQDVRNFIETFKQLPIIQEISQDFSNAMENLRNTLSNVGTSINNFFSGLSVKFSLTNLNTVLTDVYHGFKNFINGIKDFVTNIKNFVIEVYKTHDPIQAFKNNFSSLIETFKAVKEGFNDFFNNLKNNQNIEGISLSFKTLMDYLKEFASTLTPEKATALFASIAFATLAISLIRVSNALSDVSKQASQAFDSISKTIKTFKKKNKTIIMQFAESMLVLAAAFKIMETIDQERLWQITGVMATMALTIGGLVAVMGLVNKYFMNNEDSLAFSKMALGLLTITGAIGVLVGALKLLETVEVGWNILGKFAALIGLLTMTVVVSNLIKKLDKFNFGTLTLLVVATSILELAEAFNRIGQMDEGQIKNSTKAMIVLLAGLSAVAFAASNIGVFSAVGLIALVFSFEKMVPMLEKIVNYDYTAIIKGIDRNIETFKKLGTLVGVMIIVGGLMGPGFRRLGSGILSISVAMLGLIGVAKLAGMMDPREFNKGVQFLKVASILIGGLIAVQALLISHDKDTKFLFRGGSILMLTVAMAGMLGIAKLASMMKTESLVKGIVVVGVLEALLTGMMLMAKVCKDANASFKSLALILGGMAVVFAEMIVLSLLDWEDILPSFLAMAGMILSLSVLMKSLQASSKIAEQNADGAKTSISKFSKSFAGAIGVILSVAFLCAVMGTVAQQPWQQVAAAGAGMTAVIAALAVLMKVIGNLPDKEISFKSNAIKSALTSIIFVGVIGGLLWWLSDNIKNPDNVTKIASGIVIGLGGLSVAVYAIAKAGEVAENANLSTYKPIIIGAIVSILAVSGALIAITNLAGDKADIIDAAMAIGIGTLAVGLCAVLIGAAAKIAGDNKIGESITIIGGAVAAMLSVAYALAKLTNAVPKDSDIFDIALSLGMATVAVGICAILMSAAGAIASLSMASLGDLAAPIISAIGGMIVVAGALYLLADNLDLGKISILNQVAPELALVMGTLGDLAIALSVAGAICSVATTTGVITAVVAAIAGLVAVIVAAIVLGKICEKWETVEGTLMKGLDILVKISGKLGEVIGAFIGGIGVGLVDQLNVMADRLNTFTEKIDPFIQYMSTIDEKATSGAKNLAEAILALLGGSLVGTIAKLFGIKFDAIDWSGLGNGVAVFADSVKDISNYSLKKAEIASQIAEHVAELTTKIQPVSGLLVSIFGRKDLGEFGTGLAQFGRGLVQFCTSVKDLTDKDKEQVQFAADTTTILIDLARGLENTGGLWADIAGDDDLKTFGKTLVPFALSLEKVVNTFAVIQETHGDYAGIIQTAADATIPLVDLAKGLENIGGLAGKIFGNDDLGTFGGSLVSFGGSLSDFVTKLQEINDWTVFYKAKSIISDLVQLGVTANDINADIFENLKKSLKVIGGLSIEKFNESFNNDTTATTSLYNWMKRIRDWLKSNETVYKSSFSTFAYNILDGFKSGINLKAPDILNTIRELSNSIVAEMSKNIGSSKFKSFGQSIGDGLAQGISDSTAKAVEAARAQAQAVSDASRIKFDINSPSKVFRSIGLSVGEGLAQGIDRSTGMAVTSVESMSDNVISFANRAIEGIANAINTNVDVQPTIRPVLDTSDIESKASNISRLFDQQDLYLAYGASGNFNSNNAIAVSQKYKDYNQEAKDNKSSTKDIVSAVDSVRSEIGVLKDAMSNIKMVLDTGTMVGEMITPIDQALGMRAAYAGRGN